MDEKWKYDYEAHTKIFLAANFICPGCHWLKSPSWRIQTWIKQKRGLLPKTSKPDHIVDCLGWTQEKVEALRVRDLREYLARKTQLSRLAQAVSQGTAVFVPSPIEKLSEQQLAKLLQPGRLLIVPWQVDLKALSQLGYTQEEISTFEERMYNLAAKRMPLNPDASHNSEGSDSAEPTGISR